VVAHPLFLRRIFMSKWQYIVWVGGTDDYYVTFEDAQRAYDEWLDKGYDDVIIEKIKKEDCHEA
jgi:hypothetical protein|tara:strand:- start:172 stop:363 length:192 start_codon:yes stop_codon:yes gene_type:complete